MAQQPASSAAHSSVAAPAPDALRIEAIPAFKDNYIWYLQRGTRAVVVDPGEAAPVQRALEARGHTLDAIVVTHHHGDHVGGVRELAQRHRARVYGPSKSPFDHIDVRLDEGDRLTILDEAAQVLEIPGHTLDHIAYFLPGIGAVFCGDTLFSVGCGRLFEGTAPQMHTSLSRLAALPPLTRVYCGHEYTASNIRFAQAVEPANDALQRRHAECEDLRARGLPTVPSTIASETACNPFLRCNEATVRAASQAHAPGSGSNGPDVFAVLRSWKDGF